MRVACLLVMPTFKPGDQAPEGYLQWHEWAEVQHKAGLRQKECGNCGKWKYPQQISGKRTWRALDRRGKSVEVVGVICHTCAALSARTASADAALTARVPAGDAGRIGPEQPAHEGALPEKA